MSVRMIRAKIKPGKAADLEKAAQEMFTAIEAARPQGVRYASCKLPDGVTYVILLGLDDDENNPWAPYRPSGTSRRTSTPGSPGRRPQSS